MRTLSAAVLAAVDAVVTSPGHLVEIAFTPDPARWSDVGSVALPDGRTFAGVDMRVQRMGFSGDAAPGTFSIQLGNLDSAAAALLLANDVASVPLTVYGIDRRALAVADVVPLGTFSMTQARIGIDVATITCAPRFFTAPFRRVDAANGFTHATPDGTVITWGNDRFVLTRTNGAAYG